MSELTEFGLVVLVVSCALVAALLASKLTGRLPVPGPALFLLAAAGAAELFPGLRSQLSIRDVERIATVALVLILFEGGMHLGRRRFAESVLPIAALGVLGTVATAAFVATSAHVLLGLGWTTAWLIGVALAPTDPAVMFSVLGNREVAGRTSTILEGESGANDPVGIALMIGVLEFAGHDGASVWTVVREFSVQMSIGLAVGLAGAAVLLPLTRRVSLASEALYPLLALAAAGAIYGAASVAHGSGFLAVFVAGLLAGDAETPYKRETERFHGSLASLAEIAVFVALGLTIDLGDLGREGVWLDGLVLALVLALVARPLVAGILLLPARLRPGERLFVMWGGLKGAVPILLGAFALLAEVADAHRIYGIVFVVTALSVLVQGTSIPLAARLLRIPMTEPAQTLPVRGRPAR